MGYCGIFEIHLTRVGGSNIFHYHWLAFFLSFSFSFSFLLFFFLLFFFFSGPRLRGASAPKAPPLDTPLTKGRPVARVDLGGCGTPKKWTFWTQKVDFFEPHPPYLPTKTPFLAHFVAKSGPFGRFGGCVAPPAPPLVTGLTKGTSLVHKISFGLFVIFLHLKD